MATKLITYISNIFIGKKLQIDEDFIDSIKLIESYAKENDLQIYITSSTRNINQNVSGAIVKPASKSNHLVGHAIDFNILYNNRLFNSDDLENLNSCPNKIKQFIRCVRNNNSLRWGGDFTPTDVVHIDDGLNTNNPNLWNVKFNIIQQQLNPRELSLTNPYMEGNDVKELQQKLVDKSYNLNVDGVFGIDTFNAVKLFQKDSKIDIDGIVGINTKKLLKLDE